MIDFDGTVTSHEFPNIGHDIGSVPVLKKLVEKGHKLILFTMRSHRPFISFANERRDCLQEAIDWFAENDIPLYGIQAHPTQHEWTDSPKAFGQLIIDDTNLGIPLKTDKKISQRPFVDWVAVEELLTKKGLI